MRHQHGGDVQPRDEAANQVEQPCLHRNIQPASGFIHEHQPGMGDQSAGDLQPLQHAAGKRARHVIHPLGVDFHLLQPVDRLFADAAVMPRSLRHQALADIAASRHPHAQRGTRVLLHETPVRPMQRPQFRRRHRVHIMQRPGRIAVPHHTRIRTHPARQHVEQGGLTRAALTNNRQHLTRPEVNINIDQRWDGAEAQVQATRGKQGIVAHAASPTWPASRRVSQ